MNLTYFFSMLYGEGFLKGSGHVDEKSACHFTLTQSLEASSSTFGASKPAVWSLQTIGCKSHKIMTKVPYFQCRSDLLLMPKCHTFKSETWEKNGRTPPPSVHCFFKTFTVRH